MKNNYCYLPWVNCQDSRVTKEGVKELWNLRDEFDLSLCVLEIASLGLLFYSQMRWIALDIFFFQMNGLFYGSFPSFLSTFLSLLQEILKNYVDFPMKNSLALIRTWEPIILPLFFLLPLWPQIKAYKNGQNSIEPQVVSSLTSSIATVLPLLGFVLNALSIQYLGNKKAGMAIMSAILIGFYFAIPKIEAKFLQPLATKISNFSLPKLFSKKGTPTEKTSAPAKPVDPNGSSGGTNGTKKK